MRSMKKKVLVLLFFVLACAVALTGCGGEQTDYGYFVNFSSRGAFSRAEEALTLPQGTSVYSYNAEYDVFVTARTVLNTVDNTTISLFGLCSADEVYVEPIYSGIQAIHGDYAIVYKAMVYDGKNVTGVGVIKYRGEGRGELTPFSPTDTAEDLFRFVGDYVVAVGLKTYVSEDFNFVTFYNLSQGVLLEEFRLRCNLDYTFMAYDDYVVAVGTDHAFFYEKSNNVNGFLIPYRPSQGEDGLSKYGYYVPYPEDTEGEYADYIKLDIFYLGNGWFSRTAQLRDTQIFEGYQIIYEETDTSSLSLETKTYYANVRCDFYNAHTHETRSNDWLVVRAVANRYHADYYTQAASYYNNFSSYDAESETYEYHLPYLNPARAIKDGYSVVYYYYLPYVEEENYYAETSFCIVNERFSIDRLSEAELLLPPVFIDGYGVPTADPVYEPYFGPVYVYDANLKRTEVASYEGGKRTYQSYLYYDGNVVAHEYDYDKSTAYYGMVTADGRRSVDFLYDSLSPFFGEYAVGKKGKGFVRIDRQGNETPISDALNVRQGVYVNVYREKLGLKTYAGEELLSAQFDELEVLETVMERGVFLTSYVAAKKDDVVTIYRLK